MRVSTLGLGFILGLFLAPAGTLTAYANEYAPQYNELQREFMEKLPRNINNSCSGRYKDYIDEVRFERVENLRDENDIDSFDINMVTSFLNDVIKHCTLPQSETSESAINDFIYKLKIKYADSAYAEK